MRFSVAILLLTNPAKLSCLRLSNLSHR
jgi:hypothetical protein